MRNTDWLPESNSVIPLRQWLWYGALTCLISTIVIGGVLTVATGGVAAVQPTEDTVENACNEKDDNTVVVFLNNQEYETNTLVYPGAELYIGYCTANGAERPQPGGKTVWEINTKNLVGISPSANGRTYQATVASNSAVVTLNETTVSAPIENTVRIRTQREGTVKSELAQEPLVFLNDTTYRQNEQDYRNATESITESLGSLNATAEELTADGQRVNMTITVSRLREANQTLNTLRRERAAARAATTTLRSQLFTRARNGSNAHLTALENITTEQHKRSQEVNKSMKQYATKLAAVERRAQISVLTDLAIGAVPGIALGAVIAGYRTHILGRKARDFADFGRQLEWSSIFVQLVGGGALVLVGIIIAVLSGTIGVIL